MIDLGKAAGLAVAACLAATPLLAADPPAPARPSAPGVVLPDTETWDMPSPAGITYRVFVSRPTAPPPPGGFPVLYVLDGNAMFAGFAEERRVQEMEPRSPIGKSIVVGIGYPTDKAYDTSARMFDLTPAWAPDRPGGEPYAKLNTGGRDAFLDFILKTLQPEIARRYPVNARRQSLYGHSLGGLFALHVLYSHPYAFNAIIAASPSTWWNDQSLLDEEHEFTARLTKAKVAGTPARLMLVAGDSEDYRANVWDSEALAERIKPLSAYGLRSRFELYKEETHISVPSRSVTSALRWAFVLP